MSQNNRLVELCSLLRTDVAFSTHTLMETFGVSRATVMRDIEVLRDRLNYPIVYDSAQRGFVLERRRFESVIGPLHELPGMWLGTGQVYAFLTVLNVLRDIDPGFLQPYQQQFRSMMKEILSTTDFRMLGLDHKVTSELSLGSKAPPHVFSVVATALLQGRLLTMLIESAGQTDRLENVLPLKVVLTSTGWVLDLAPCESSSARRLAFGEIKEAALADLTPAKRKKGAAPDPAQQIPV